MTYSIVARCPETSQVAVVEPHRHLDGDLPVGRGEDGVQRGVQVEDRGRLGEYWLTAS